MKKSTIILKIGGSVITHKNSASFIIRKGLLDRIGAVLNKTLRENPNIQLVIIHGAGSAGHQIAKKHNLISGTGDDSDKIEAALQIRLKNQLLNATITEILFRNKLRVVPIHTASCIVQRNGVISHFDHAAMDEALEKNYIPILYGEMVFDTNLGMSVCSGDSSAVYLARLYSASAILYASDVDGIFDKDPHLHKNAKLVGSHSLQSLIENQNVTLSKSHHVDVTGGLANKLATLRQGGIPPSLKHVTIFNGLKPALFAKALGGEDVGTVITIRS